MKRWTGLKAPADGSLLAIDELVLGDGERLVVFGPNGAGKTTLLRILASRGETAVLPQRPYLFRGTAGWNLGLGHNAETASQARALAEELGVGDLLASGAETLSGGERQRVALARTLAGREPIVLLDEPLAAIAAADRSQVAQVLLSAIGDRSAVIVTHDRDEAAMLGTSLAVLAGGRIAQSGPVGEVFSLPATPEVAAILGIQNVIGGETVAGEGELSALLAGGAMIWGLGALEPGVHARALFGAEGVTVYAGEHLDAGSARNRWSGTVTHIRGEGTVREIVADVGFRAVALVTPGSLEALDLRAGSAVTFTAKATAVRIVPA